jgi:hypothetical protein
MLLTVLALLLPWWYGRSVQARRAAHA